MGRELTDDFICDVDLKFSVRVFDGKVTSTERIVTDTIIFILNPVKLNQQDFVFLLKHKAIYIFIKWNTKEYTLENHPLKLLFKDSYVNEHLNRIKGLNKNVMELYLVKNRWWDLFNLSSSYKQLFSIKNIGFCFVEYPVISESILNLDDIFIRDIAKVEKPTYIINKYLKYIEEDSNSKIESVNRRNAFKNVFLFYEGNKDEYEFNLEQDKILFLLDVLQLENLSNDPKRCANLIGALTSACAYFVHIGQPQPYICILNKILKISMNDHEKVILRYTHIPDAIIEELKNENLFLYYHLSCRIPNQYLVALFDLFLTTENEEVRKNYEEQMEWLTRYLKEQIEKLSLIQSSFLWEFKRDQEIGAIAGTLGQIALYKKATIDGKFSAFDEAEKYIKIAIEYAHPLEKERDMNYLIHCRLSRMVQIYDKNLEISKIERELDEISKNMSIRFQHTDQYNPFDIMLAAEIIAVANAVLSDEYAVKLNDTLGFNWRRINTVMEQHPYIYASYLVVAYFMLFPKKSIDSIENIQVCIDKGKKFFHLDQDHHLPVEIMDLIAVKYIIGHSYYLCRYHKQEDLEMEILNHYKKWINKLVLPEKLQELYIKYIDLCSHHDEKSQIKALQLMYRIPY